MNLERMTNEEIETEMAELSKMQLGTDEYKATIDGITKLMDRSIKLKELEKDSKEKAEALEAETRLKEEEIEIDKKDKRTRNVIAGVSVIGGLGVTVWGAIKSWKFEEHGYVSSSAGRKFMDNLFKILKK